MFYLSWNIYCHIVFLEIFIDYRCCVYQICQAINISEDTDKGSLQRQGKALRSALYSYAKLKIMRSGAIAQWWSPCLQCALDDSYQNTSNYANWTLLCLLKQLHCSLAAFCSACTLLYGRTLPVLPTALLESSSFQEYCLLTKYLSVCLLSPYLPES